jgi:PAS domain S-box-containing protein
LGTKAKRPARVAARPRRRVGGAPRWQRAERGQREAEGKFAALFENSPEPISLMRISDHVRLAANTAWERVTGHSRQRASSRPATAMSLFRSPAEREALIGRVERESMVSNVEQRLVRADGTEFDALISGVCLEVGGERCILWNWRDISEQRLLERTQHEASSRYRALFESVLDGIMIGTPQHGVIEANPAACAMTGYAAEELAGMHVGRLFQPGELDLRPLRDLGRKWSLIERVLLRKDGATLPVEILGGPLPDGKVLAIWRDITERKRTEALMRQTNEALEQLVRSRTAELEEANRELESYNYSISHDLRQPLNAIAGFAELLREQAGASLDAAALDSVGEIESNAARMENMIESLMRLARAGRGAIHKAEVDARPLVESVLHDLASAAPLVAEVVLGELPPAHGDPVLLRQVWANLVGNAVKYSRNSPAPRVEISGERRDGVVEYTVRDNGVGFDMQHAGRLFGTFQRLPTAAGFEGSGIGLAIAERIVRRHGGSINAESAPGAGATFRFSLPD